MDNLMPANGETTTAPASSKIRAYIWDLEDEKNEESAPTSAEAMFYVHRGQESIIGKDERVRVSRQDILPGGKYRGKHIHSLNIANQRLTCLQKRS
jgi:hypothetical protein